MGFRDEKWYERAVEQAQAEVKAAREQLNKHMDSADHSIAAMKCDTLKAALTKLNDLENAWADWEEKHANAN